MQDSFLDVMTLDGADATGWAGLLLGLAMLAAGIGALRRPGMWLDVAHEIEHSGAMQLLSGMLEVTIGAAIYLTVPWTPGDLFTCVMKGLGGLMIVEALVILSLADVYSQMWLRTLGNFGRGWAAVTTMGGLALTVFGAIRFA